MTTIKIKGDLAPVKTCMDCPFIDYVDEVEYGELSGWATAYCRLLHGTESIIGDTRDTECGDKKLDNCPIISIE